MGAYLVGHRARRGELGSEADRWMGSPVVFLPLIGGDTGSDAFTASSPAPLLQAS